MSDFLNIEEKWLTPNEWSRPQIPMEEIRAIVIHWVANPNTSSFQNYLYFENKKYGFSRHSSAHSIIDLDGSILKIIPENEIAYHSGDEPYNQDTLNKLNTTYPNKYTYSIELTHKNWDGELTEDTYHALIEWLAELCTKWGLDPQTDIIRHYDVTGKGCPRWFVTYPDEFKKLKDEVEFIMDFKTSVYKDWQIELGKEAINDLADDGIINNPEQHIENLDKGYLPPWLSLTIMSRLNKKINKSLDK